MKDFMILKSLAALIVTSLPATAATVDIFKGGEEAITTWSNQAGPFSFEDFESFSPGDQLDTLTQLGLSFSPLPSGLQPAVYSHGGNTSLGRGNLHIGQFPAGIRPTVDRFSNIELTVNTGFEMTGFGVINGDGQNSISVISAYDAAGNLLATVDPGRGQFGGLLSSTAIASVTLDGGMGSDGYDHWDFIVSNANATTTAVPIPAGMMMLPVGLAALVACRKKSKSK